jgi:hypothetical protein
MRGLDLGPDITTDTTELSRWATERAFARLAASEAEIPGVLVEANLCTAGFRPPQPTPQRSSNERHTHWKERSTRCRVVG